MAGKNSSDTQFEVSTVMPDPRKRALKDLSKHWSGLRKRETREATLNFLLVSLHHLADAWALDFAAAQQQAELDYVLQRTESVVTVRISVEYKLGTKDAWIPDFPREVTVVVPAPPLENEDMPRWADRHLSHLLPESRPEVAGYMMRIVRSDFPEHIGKGVFWKSDR